MNILAVDTSSKAASVALYCDNMIMGECMYNHGKNHSVYIAPMIDEMLEACNLRIKDIDYFACGIGPGSFTGVRIGVTMMKTFAMVADKPCVSVDSLFALADSFASDDKIVVAIEDARRNRVFVCAVKNGETVIETAVLPIEELFDKLSEYDNSVLFVGGGSRIYKQEITEKGFSVDVNGLISGRVIANTAIKKINSGKLDDCISLLPKYLLKSQAEQTKNANNQA